MLEVRIFKSSKIVTEVVCLPKILGKHKKDLSEVAGCSYSDITPVIEFTAELQSNDLTYHRPYTKRQQITYNLVRHLHDERCEVIVLL